MMTPSDSRSENPMALGKKFWWNVPKLRISPRSISGRGQTGDYEVLCSQPELRRRVDERALMILAHYCVLLKKIDHVWYLKGVGEELLENIRQSLSKEWRPRIKWAIDQPVSQNFEGSKQCLSLL